MPRVWRLVTGRFADTAFSGEGARRYGGRWNRKGVPVVYTAGSLSLAMLEMLVQDQPLRARYMAIPAEIPQDLEIERVELARLPPDWRDPASLEAMRAVGSDWAAALVTAVLAVPSAVIPIETNFLLNPRHPAFARIGIGKPEELITDLRLIVRRPPAGLTAMATSATPEHERRCSPWPFPSPPALSQRARGRWSALRATFTVRPP